MSKIKRFFKAFKHAFSGIKLSFKELSMQCHILAAAVVLIGGKIFGLDRMEWFAILILIALVWTAELFNTAIEELANLIQREQNLAYKATQKVRDLSAGAVLVIAMAAAVIGTAIFAVKIIEMWC